MATSSEQFRRFLESIKTAYIAFNKSLKKSHEENSNTFNFQPLTPINDVNLDIYEDAISFVFHVQTLRMLPYQAHTVQAKVALSNPIRHNIHPENSLIFLYLILFHQPNKAILILSD
ncbi:hypothetical protein CFSAN002237_02555 [Escherichia coli O104:H21 str. CFSAN002237]|nr:hypothetical protein CFSAN002237_02555 [Escherichia coli O104:H21 str. CFSAN002237]